MKKAIFIFSIFMGFALQAQETKLLGLRAGWQHSRIDFGDAYELNPINGFYVGVFKDIKLFPFAHFQGGIEYLQNGSGDNSTGKVIYHTLSVPLHIKGKVGPVYALAGVSANFVLGDQFKIDGVSSGIPDFLAPKTFDLPVSVGAGFKFLMFAIEARYHWGTMDVSKLDIGRCQYFQLGATFSL